MSRPTRPFGVNPTTTDEFRHDEPYDPYLGYGHSKMIAEERVRAAHGNGLDTVVVRPPWFYGPWQPLRQTTFFRLIRTGRFPLIGDGSQRRSMVFVDNLVQGVVLAERHPDAPRRGLLDRGRAALSHARDPGHRQAGPTR
ncbi:MAG: NAD-dependent epimerase/dehydratase family protein [Nocardioidaceae bacterium]